MITITIPKWLFWMLFAIYFVAGYPQFVSNAALLADDIHNLLF